MTQDLQAVHADLDIGGLKTFTLDGNFWVDLDSEGSYYVAAWIDQGDHGEQRISRDVYVSGETNVTLEIPRPMNVGMAYEYGSKDAVLTWSSDYQDLTIDVYRRVGPLDAPWIIMRQLPPGSPATVTDGEYTSEFRSYRLEAWGTRSAGDIALRSAVVP